jgi:hypothetical protein
MVTVTGDLGDVSLGPVMGTVSFTPPSYLVAAPESLIFPPSPVTVTLSNEGTFTVELVACDNADLQPTDWTYYIEVKIPGIPVIFFNAYIPSEPSTVDLSDLIPVPASIGVAYGFATAAALATEVAARIAGDLTLTEAIAALSGTYARALSRTSVKTGNYSAGAGDLVPWDLSGGSYIQTLPAVPADKTVVAAKIIVTPNSTNTLTIASAGSDVFNKAGGSTTLTLLGANRGVLLQYDVLTGIWTVLSDDLPLSFLDTRYTLAPLSFAAQSVLTSGASSGSALTWTAASATVARALGWVVVTDPQFGAKGNVQHSSNVSMTSGVSPVLTDNAATANWTSANIGQPIVVSVTGTTAYTATIASVQSATQVTLSGTAGSSVANRTATWGSDDTAAIQAAINSLPNGGSVYFPDLWFFAANLRIPTICLAFRGSNSQAYGFASARGIGPAIQTTPGAPTSGVGAVVLGSPGSGYTSAPTVSFSGGGGTGAAATAYISGGVVQAFRITDPGIGYTSAPTVTLTGGGGTGASATSVALTPLFYTSGTPGNLVEFDSLMLSGGNVGGTQGLVFHNVANLMVNNCRLYGFDVEALWLMAGSGGTISDCKIFGVNRSSAIYISGSLRVGGSDMQLTNLEIGGGFTNDQVNLWNAAFYVDGGSAMMAANVVGEGADIGGRITGQNNRFVNSRCDINYGHGWLLIRDVASFSPPVGNYFTSCWGHRNSKYGSNLFDNFHVDGNSSVSNNHFLSPNSTIGSGDTWQIRYGFYDGSSNSTVLDLSSTGAITAPSFGLSSLPNIQVFTSSGTWTAPPGANTVEVWLMAGGGGGASGENSASSAVAAGGGGGGGGAKSYHKFIASDLTSTVPITVGSGGAGAAAISATSTPGAVGSNGGSSSFGSYLQAVAGSGASAASSSSANGGGGGGGTFNGGQGAAGSVTGAAGNNAAAISTAGGGGGAGGGVSSGNVAAVGGTGFSDNDRPGNGGGQGGAIATNGTSGINRIPANEALGGTGGGGGGGAVGANGGNGGAAALYGGGGGGGGAAQTGHTSGAGGAGAGGICIVITT